MPADSRTVSKKGANLKGHALPNEGILLVDLVGIISAVS